MALLISFGVLGGCASAAGDAPIVEGSQSRTASAYAALVRSPQLREWVAALVPTGNPAALVVEATPVSLPGDAHRPAVVPPELWSAIVGSAMSEPSSELMAAAETVGLPTLAPEDERRLFQTDPPDFGRYVHWQAGWPAFAQLHPGATGILGLSPFAATADGKSGVAYVQVLVPHRHGQCGFGGVALLAQEHGEWRVQHYETTWVGY